MKRRKRHNFDCETEQDMEEFETWKVLFSVVVAHCCTIFLLSVYPKSTQATQNDKQITCVDSPTVPIFN